MATPAELDAMRQAIALSALGLGTTSPNPSVGCVILDPSGTQVGAGYHQRKGEPHAEAHALAAAGPRAAGGTAVVTLEPCNHVGITPACRQLLLDSHISRVVIAVRDPTSRGDGGAAVLQAAGIDVEVGVLTDEARLVLRPWLTATQRHRPWVTVHASSVRPDDIADLRHRADIVIDRHGRITEGIPGGHGTNMLHHPPTFYLTDATASLHELYQGGVRSVLAPADSDAGRALLDHDLTDETVLCVPGHGWPSEPGSTIESITPTATGTRVVLTRPTHGARRREGGP